MKKRKKYYIEINDLGIEASGYEDRLPWCCYDSIVSEGDTLNELLSNASVFLMDQDGGEVGEVDADEDWMQDAIVEEFKRITSLRYKLHKLYKKTIKPFKPLTYYETWSGKKPNLVQKLLYK